MYIHMCCVRMPECVLPVCGEIEREREREINSERKKKQEVDNVKKE